MLKVKRCILVMLSLMCAIAVLAGFGVQAKRIKKEFKLPDTSSAETSTSRYTQYYEAQKIAGNRLTTEGYTKLLENEALELWYNEDVCSIRVVDKQSGYIWGSLKTESEMSEEDKDVKYELNNLWQKKATSLFTIEYYDTTNSSNELSMIDESFYKEYEAFPESNEVIFYIDNQDIGLYFEFSITLHEDHITAGVVKGSMEEYDSNFSLSSLELLPFFASTRHGEMDGYIFIPDGSGALMRFDPNTLHTSAYNAKLYGKDASIDDVNVENNLEAKRTNDFLVEPYRASIPVYGIVHGDDQYAAMTVIEGGKEYATFNATLADGTAAYNRASVKFEYRQKYSQPVSKSTSIIRPQKNRNSIVPSISIYLLSDDEASYNGMAHKYRSLLEEEGLLDELADAYEEQIPLRLEVLGSDVKQGFIFNGVQTFTNTSEALDMQKSLSEKGISNLTMVLTGWQKGGVNGSAYGDFSLQGSVGSWDDIAKLRDSVKNAGGAFYLQTKTATITSAQGKTSYLAAQTISKKLAHYLRDNPSVMFKETYLVNPHLAANNLKKAANELKGFDLNLPRLGYELYSHHAQTEQASSTRTRTRGMFVEQAAKATEKGTKLAMNAPNYYLWGSCSDYFDMPMMNSQYLYESDSVPFLQILLKGYINYYAPYANQGFYTTACTLKTIEYGAYPSFLVMAANNADLNKTPMVDYFSLNFDDWSDKIEEVYNMVNGALVHVEGAMIAEHKVLDQGVVRVTYDNDVKIYINYNSFEVSVDGVKIPKLNFVVEGV